MAALFAVAGFACAGGTWAMPALALGAGGPAPARAVSVVSPVGVDFGSLQLGTATAPATVTLTNSGVASLVLSRFGVASSSVNASDFGVVSGGTCSVSVPLASGESCTVLVRFKPTAAGARSGLLSFWDNTLAGRVNVTLAGVGTLPPVSVVSPVGVDFGSVQLGTASDPVTVTLTNSGVGSLVLSRFGVASSSVNAADFGVVSGGTCSVSVSVPLASGESCTVLVRFKPTASGARTGLLSFWDNTLAGRINVALAGDATPPPVSSLAVASLDFGLATVGVATAPATVTLTNSGVGSLVLSRFGVASSSVNASDFGLVSGGTCSVSVSVPLAGGESCTVLVRFKPTASGARTGLLSFWDNTLAGRIDVALAGDAAPPPVSSLAVASLDFGLVTVGVATAPVTVTITNSGSGSLSFWRIGIASSSASPADFAVVGGGTCSLATTLASGEACTVLVRFRPTASGARTGFLSFWDNTLAGRIDVTLIGSGDDPCTDGCF